LDNRNKSANKAGVNEYFFHSNNEEELIDITSSSIATKADSKFDRDLFVLSEENIEDFD